VKDLTAKKAASVKGGLLPALPGDALALKVQHKDLGALKLNSALKYIK
jgi:hypothetical protein